MTLPPAHAQWLSRLYAAQTRSWAYLVATAGTTAGVSLAVAPFLVLFGSPVLPAALVTAVPIGPSVWLGVLIGIMASIGQFVIHWSLRRRLGAPPADLGSGVTLLTLIPYARAQRVLHWHAIGEARRAEHAARGWFATALWIYGRVFLAMMIGALIVGVIGGRLTIG